MRFLSVCSGIEAASVAWEPLGWKAAAFCEIEKFPSAVLAHHYPDVPNLGDMTKIDYDRLEPIDLLVGGTPCQSFSVAGLRGGMDDDRGNLALEFVRIAMATRPRWVVWENVPGVLSSNEGRDFGSFLGALGEIGYGFAYRVLDAQYFGLAQRRKRVFVVGYLGDWRPPAAVLFERESLCGDPAPSRQEGEGAAAGAERGVGEGRRMTAFGEYKADEMASTVKARDHKDATDLVVTQTLRMRSGCAGGGKGALVSEEQSLTLATASDQTLFAPTAFDARQSGVLQYGGKTGPLDTDGGSMGIHQGYAVRRLTPVECERLQGFPDGYTNIPWRGKPTSPDGPRYKSLGNSMAVPVMRWIGERIQAVKHKKTEPVQTDSAPNQETTTYMESQNEQF